MMCDEVELSSAGGDVNVDPLYDPAQTYMVSHAPFSKKDLCNSQDETDQDYKLAEHCEAFCGANAIPYLLGSTSYGFNLDEAQMICAEVAPPALRSTVTKSQQRMNA